MGFMDSYKRLDNLCRDMNGIGVTGYINDMESRPDGNYRIPGWNDDYLKLKNYRYIRNQIAHENYANEADMCSDADITWVENFYQRIIIQRDPLSLYCKNINQRTSTRPKAQNLPQSPQRIPAYPDTTYRTPGKPTVPSIPQNPQYIPAYPDKNKTVWKVVKGTVKILLSIAVAVFILIACLS